jgi:putative transposase
MTGVNVATSPMHTGRPQRLKTFDYVGYHRYSLTYCTYYRECIFVEPGAVRLVLSHILRAGAEQQFTIPASCFMPDHVHMLVHGNSEASDCRMFIKLSTQYAGYAYSQKYRRKLWQPWGFERVLRSDEQSHTVARYILENPVRAGIAKSVLDYRFVGSQLGSAKDVIEGLPFKDR